MTPPGFLPHRLVASVLCAVALAAAAIPARAQSGATSPEQKLRVARRLAAENSPDAGAAFAKLVADHPDDPLADDALVERAVWLGAPAWPEEIKTALEDRLRAAMELLRRAAESGGDRRAEALYRLVLTEIAAGLDGEHSTRRSPQEQRRSLIGVATMSGAGPWPDAARYAIAWLDENSGEFERARAAYLRLAIDESASEVGRRALVGVGRVLLRSGEPGGAAARFQEAVEEGASSILGAVDLRELAVRNLLRTTGGQAGWEGSEALTWSSGIRGAVAIARTRDGGTLVADRRGRAVLLFDRHGAPVGRWDLESLQALAVDPLGRMYAAAGTSVYRLESEGRTSVVAGQGDFVPASGLAADAAGRLFLTDRRGDRVGIVAPGSANTALLRERRGAAFAGIVWDGARLLAGEGKTGRIVEIRGDGTERPVVAAGATSVAAIAVDAAGSIAVIDARADVVVLFSSKGEILDRFRYGVAGYGRIAGVALGRRGDLDLLEVSTGNVVRLP